MSGMLPSFLAGAALEIRMGSTVLAYAQNCAWTDDMTTAPVGGIGSYSQHALEPLAYIGRGSMTLTHYSTQVFNAIQAGLSDKNWAPSNMDASAPLPATSQNNIAYRDGNSLLGDNFFNPVSMLVSRTFDINVYEKVPNGRDANGKLTYATSNQIYTLVDCRMTNLSMTFTPGTLVNQVVSFLCRSVIDLSAESYFNKKAI